MNYSTKIVVYAIPNFPDTRIIEGLGNINFAHRQFYLYPGHRQWVSDAADRYHGLAQ